MHTATLHSARPIGACALALAAALLAGCSSSATGNQSLESIRQPVVSEDYLTFDARADGGFLSAGEAERFHGWLGALDIRYGDTVLIDRQSGYGPGSANEQLAQLVADRGILVVDAATPGTPPGAVRVAVRRSRAEVPGCPDWSSKSARNFNNATSSNFGCGVNSNMAAMVADPEDLVRGTPGPAFDPRAGGRAVDLYRKRKPTGEQPLSTAGTQRGGDQ